MLLHKFIYVDVCVLIVSMYNFLFINKLSCNCSNVLFHRMLGALSNCKIRASFLCTCEDVRHSVTSLRRMSGVNHMKTNHWFEVWLCHGHVKSCMLFIRPIADSGLTQIALAPLTYNFKRTIEWIVNQNLFIILLVENSSTVILDRRSCRA